ncbi:MAG: hypothetical protein EB100_02050 [Crocinitomicaceae bacterium]|nr:hypothetical protein [Crocinitomicaceae bacterium]
MTQAKGVGMAISSHRLNAPVCMGTIYWQLNDCWPGPTWSSIDFNGNWKALQYHAKRLFKNVTVLEDVKELNNEKYFITSDLPSDLATKFNLKVRSEDGEVLFSKSDSLKLKQFDKVELLKPNEWLEFQKLNVIVDCEWTDEKNNWNNQKFYHQGNNKGSPKTDVSDVKWNIVMIDSIHKTGVLEITSPYLLRDCWMTSENKGVHFYENFQNYLPGTHRISFKFNDLPPTKKSLRIVWR